MALNDYSAVLRSPRSTPSHWDNVGVGISKRKHPVLGKQMRGFAVNLLDGGTEGQPPNTRMLPRHKMDIHCANACIHETEFVARSLKAKWHPLSPVPPDPTNGVCATPKSFARGTTSPSVPIDVQRRMISLLSQAVGSRVIFRL